VVAAAGGDARYARSFEFRLTSFAVLSFELLAYVHGTATIHEVTQNSKLKTQNPHLMRTILHGLPGHEGWLCIVAISDGDKQAGAVEEEGTMFFAAQRITIAAQLFATCRADLRRFWV
jgi:hypothetical protein